MAEQVYEDRWGEVFDRPSADLIELRWFDTTANMSAHEFQDWLTKFAECVEKSGRSKVLIDSTTFRMSPPTWTGYGATPTSFPATTPPAWRSSLSTCLKACL